MSQDDFIKSHAEMRVVSSTEFHEFLRMDRRDIMPTTIYPDQTIWQTPNRQTVCATFPGWRNATGNAKVYMIPKTA